MALSVLVDVYWFKGVCTCGVPTTENALNGIGKDCDHSSLSMNCMLPRKYQILGFSKDILET